jgi:hypothetical protein
MPALSDHFSFIHQFSATAFKHVFTGLFLICFVGDMAAVNIRFGVGRPQTFGTPVAVRHDINISTCVSSAEGIQHDDLKLDILQLLAPSCRVVLAFP